MNALKRYGARNIVVDPVMISKSGAALLKDDAVETLKKLLIPMASVICPNIPEAERLTGMAIISEDDIRRALGLLHDLGPDWVLLKGGHLRSVEATDYLYDGKEIVTYRGPRIDTVNTHGTGCTYSAAIACYLASGKSPVSAVGKAKEYVTGAIVHSDRLRIGHGAGPLHHGWNLESTMDKD